MEISESESDHSEGNDDSGSNNTVTNPIEGHTLNMEQENMEELIPGELQETDNEEQEKIHFIRWFSLLLLRIKLHYNLSNTLFTVLLNVIYFIFVIFRHPLHMMFPKTIGDIEIISNLKVLNKTVIFAVCPNPKCSALYDLNDISVGRSGQQKPALCKKKIWGKKCCTELSFEKKLSFGRTKMVPFKTFPFLPPSEWIKTYFKQEQFLSLIKNRPEPSSTDYRDIWDGNILQQFMVDPGDGRPLLKCKTNLALLLYLDFFNPFQRAVYSCGALYISVLNIPKSQRFKAKWTMLTGLIPGPSEPEGHVNSYLSPIVDDLLTLYTGIQIQSCGGKVIFSRSLLLPVLADMPASRKLSQYKSHKADQPCDKCRFQAVREKGTRGASGKMSFYTKQSCPLRTDEEVRKAMNAYKKASSKASAQTVSQKQGVKYSELSRLPYFDMVKNFLIDPMHNLLMGLVSDIGDVLITNNNNLMSDKERETLARRLSVLRVPYDLGRLPKTMLEKMSARGLKAQQWKNFIVTYARVCLWNIVPYQLYDIVKCLAEVIEIMLKDPISRQEVDEISSLLHKHHALYAKYFGKFEVSVNYHMALHIPEVIRNWGHPTSWWCFPYERHIGMLGEVNTSGKTVEEEIFRNFVMHHLIDAARLPSLSSICENDIPQPLQPFIDPYHNDCKEDHNEEWAVFQRIQAERFFKGKSTTHQEEPPTDPMSDDRSLELQMKVEREDLEEVECWPIEMLPPRRLKQRPKIQFYSELKSYLEDIHEESLVFVEPRIDIFARCLVNGSTFSSAYNRTDRGQTALVYCVDKLNQRDAEGEVSPYFVRINFFFTARVHLKESNGVNEMRIHHMANVDWFQFANKDHTIDKLSGLPALKNTFYRREHIVNVRRLIRRVALLEVKKNYQLVSTFSR